MKEEYFETMPCKIINRRNFCKECPDRTDCEYIKENSEEE